MALGMGSMVAIRSILQSTRSLDDASTADDGKFQIATNFKDGKVKIVVNALDMEDRFLNFLDMSAVGVTPDLKPFRSR